ncbi:MAG: RagB/SusD family nutrient uptake outer membrane protein [Peptostreptococcaceae bacterium]|nr:RagB/SusD family nutrient uptake outer membrane protein [Peptostreptococcaceae bacterium]
MKLKLILATGLLVILCWACTDLSETLYDKVDANDYGTTDTEIATIVGRAYASLRGGSFDGANGYAFSEYIYFLSAISSDEAVLPARNGGADWYDGGRYIQLQSHQWNADNVILTGAWRYCYNGISIINAVISQVEQSSLAGNEKENIFAELRAVRAYYYYRLLDWFGNVPLITDYNDLSLPTNTSRSKVFEFVEEELLDVIDMLPETGYGRMTKDAGNCLLARLYLNSKVFNGEERWQDCLDVCSKISGQLESDYFINFQTENQDSKEIIFAIPYDHKMGTTGNFLNWTVTHDQQKWSFSPTGNFVGGGNSIVAQPGLYSSFEEGDIRRRTMLIGDQIDIRTGEVIDRDLNMPGLQPLSFTEEIGDIMDAKDYEGVHWCKYEQKDGEGWERDHDLVVMRYAEVLMMQAECYVRLGQPGNAHPFIDQIFARAGLPVPVVIDLALIEDALKKEFVFEDHRRTDMIRFGTFFTETWWEKKEETPKYKGVFPIPTLELQKNNKLIQNPGY